MKCMTPSFLCFVCVLVVSWAHGVAAALSDFDSDIVALSIQIRAEQWNDTVPCEFPFQTGHEKGKFANNVHFNYVGNPTMQALRSIAIPDDNMFVTSFVLESLFETMLLAGELVKPNDDSITSAVEAVLTVRDKNLPPTLPVFGFWPQQLLNFTAGTYFEQWPINLANAAKQGVAWDMWLKQIMTDLGLASLWDEIGPEIATFLSGLEVMFQIPSDSDDTSVVLALQHYWKRVANLVPNAYGVWNTTGFRPSTAFQHISQYSYCPAHTNPDKNTIDPRTYFWSHEYFNNVTDATECFVATWLQNSSFSRRVVLNETVGPQMPINVNNVDPTVGSNFLYAMSSSLLYGDEGTSWFSENSELVSLYVSTANFLHYALSTQPWQKRPDLEMLYYPPEYNLVYFTSRHLRMLESYLADHNTTEFPVPEISVVYNSLKLAARGGGMTLIESKMNTSCWPWPSTDTCWDGFLGHADTNADNVSTPHYDDRFFSSGVVLNAMVDMWTRTTQGGVSTEWLPDTPLTVKGLINSTAYYLHNALQQGNMSFENSFFSGSGKYWEQYPFWYPANSRYDFRTGAPLNCSNVTLDDMQANYYYWMMGASGKIPDDEFVQLAQEGCAGIAAPDWFTGYNGEKAFGHDEGAKGHAWPYWSAPVMSKALALQGLAKVRLLY